MANFVDFLQALTGGGGPSQYVKDNWPSDGVHAFHLTRPETLYTPYGGDVPPGGRGPTMDEMVAGAPMQSQLRPFLSLLLNRREKGE